MAQVTIIPAILTKDLGEAVEKLNLLSGVCERVQVDILDNVFANNLTIDPSQLADIETNLFIDYHLMVKEPIDWVDRCIDGQADRIIGQIEMMWSQKLFIEEVKERGLGVGLALDIDTPVEKLDPAVLYAVDVVLVMSVKAGFGGQEFSPNALGKIKELDHIRARDELSFTICDDGGMTLENSDDVHVLGVEEIAVGKRIFEGDIRTNIKEFKKAAYKVE